MAPSATTYKNLTIVTPEPLSGPGGVALNSNFKYIADQLQSLNNNQLTKVSPATLNNIATLKADGLLKDSGIPIGRLSEIADIPTAVDPTKTGYVLTNQGDGTTDWAVSTGSVSGTPVSELDIDTTTVDLDTLNDTDGTAVNWDYVVRNNTTDGNLRAGTITAVWEESDPDSDVEWFEVHTNDIGDTSAVTFNVVKNDTSDTIILQVTTSSNNWDVKAIRRLISF